MMSIKTITVTLAPHNMLNYVTLDIAFGRWPTVDTIIKIGKLFLAAMAYDIDYRECFFYERY